MPTLDFTKGGSATGTSVQWHAVKNTFTVAIRLNSADIIAADATMTTNGYIAANDVIQVMHWPARHVITHVMLETIVAGTATVTSDIGKAGSQILGAAYDMAATAGTLEVNSVADGSIDDWFAGADTVDVEFLTANCLVGDWRLFLEGTYLPARGRNG